MYEELEEDPYMRDEMWRDNYDTVGDHEDFVREHFAAECEEGLMEKLDIDEARRIYGDKIAISSLSVLVEEKHGNKKRIIHDATHGTKINNRIKCRDKQRSPGARENYTYWTITRRRRSSSAWLVISAKPIDVACIILQNVDCWLVEFRQETILFSSTKLGLLEWHQPPTGGAGLLEQVYVWCMNCLVRNCQ